MSSLAAVAVIGIEKYGYGGHGRLWFFIAYWFNELERLSFGASVK